MRDGVLEGRVGLDVRAGLVPDQRLRPLEVRVLDREHAVGAGVVEGPEHRVALAEEQPPAGPQQFGDDPGPAADVRQPAQGADAGEDEVEAARGPAPAAAS